MGTKLTYPPNYVKPGETVRLEADNGVVEFIGVYDDKVLDFFVAYVKLEKLAASPMQVSDQSLQAASREVAQAWNQMPAYTMKKIMERMEPGQIWVPEGGTDAI